jgi:hypothetical protein
MVWPNKIPEIGGYQKRREKLPTENTQILVNSVLEWV